MGLYVRAIRNRKFAFRKRRWIVRTFSFGYKRIDSRTYMFGYRHGEKAVFAADREHQAVRVQLKFFDEGRFPKLLIEGEVSVLVVSDNRAAKAGKVNSDLVCPAGMQPDRKKAVGFRAFKKLVCA